MSGSSEVSAVIGVSEGDGARGVPGLNKMS
jgi:hypothetical protein